MQVQLTNAGAALLDANTGPITLTTGKLGSAFNYTPEPTDTNIHGTAVFTTVPTSPIAVNANIVRYSLTLDYSAGPFDFGEVGLFTEDGTLFALGVSSTLIHKLALTNNVGNSIRIDIYLSMISQNYEMWLDLAESNNQFRCAVLGSPDQLPPSQAATPNMYIISGESQYQSAFIAYTDRQGLWNFDAYDYANSATATVTAFDNKSVTIALTDYNSDMHPDFLGEVIMEYTSGANFGICRYVESAVISGEFATLGFVNTVQTLPVVGDKIVVYARRALTVDQNLPIASSTILGAIKVGNSLTINGTTGVLDVDYTKVPYPVKTVAGRTGDIVLTYQDIGGLATVAHTGDYNDLINKPAAYTLPIASLTTLGGVKAPASGNITISGTGVIDIGFTPVTSVQGKTGAVSLVATDIPGFATVATTGSYNDLIDKPTIPSPYTLPIASATVLGGIKIGSGLNIDASGVVTVTGGYTLPVATTTVLGGVKQGANVAIAGDGTISVAAPYTLPTASSGVLGGVKVGSGLAIDGSGVLSASYSLPIASATVLGGIKVGTGLSIDGTGVLSASGAVSSVSGQTGAVVVQASDNNAASGTTLISNSGSTTGNIKLKTIVAGTGITLAADANGNLQISSSGAVSSVSTLTGAVVVQATDTSTASGTTLITDSGSTTANIKIRRIVAGSGITVAADGNNNLQISASGSGVTTFNTRSGAVTLTSADITSATGALQSDVAAAKYYDVQGGSAGVMTASQLVAQHVCARALNFSANFAGSQGYAGTAASASTTFIVNKIHSGTTTQIGTMVFAASGTTATFTTTGGTAQTTVVGDVIQIVAPASPDATLANMSVTLLSLAT